ncbi:unnamed protein product [Heligmosomoides polygyrus]|uniref:Uncharacterized protein n=1 Tax=Heligmosomoides polygyrus TaxID=6339 RepID=A0A183G700_HELPZ|nr:unnamed protein product [Heligmosomoides polygyrus]
MKRQHDEKMEDQFSRHHGARTGTLEPGDLRRKSEMDRRTGNQETHQCIYDVMVQGQIWKRQANQLRRSSSTTEATPFLDDVPLLPCHQTQQPTQCQESAPVDNFPTDIQQST